MQNKMFNGLEIAKGHELCPLDHDKQITLAINYEKN